MSDSWSQSIERLAFATRARGHRVIALTSPQLACGVSTVARRLSKHFALSGFKALLVDFSGQSGETPAATWEPGVNGPGQAIVRAELSADYLQGRVDEQTQYRYCNVQVLRDVFVEQLAHYDAIVVDAPTTPRRTEQQLSAAPICAACDGTVLVTMSGRTTKTEIAEALDALANAQVKLLGTIMNDQHNPTLGMELARESRRLARWLPRLSSRVASRALSSAFLN